MNTFAHIEELLLLSHEVTPMISLPLSTSSDIISAFKSAGYIIEFYLDYEVEE